MSILRFFFYINNGTSKNNNKHPYCLDKVNEDLMSDIVFISLHTVCFAPELTQKFRLNFVLGSKKVHTREGNLIFVSAKSLKKFRN